MVNSVKYRIKDERKVAAKRKVIREDVKKRREELEKKRILQAEKNRQAADLARGGKPAKKKEEKWTLVGKKRKNKADPKPKAKEGARKGDTAMVGFGALGSTGNDAASAAAAATGGVKPAAAAASAAELGFDLSKYEDETMDEGEDAAAAATGAAEKKKQLPGWGYFSD